MAQGSGQVASGQQFRYRVQGIRYRELCDFCSVLYPVPCTLHLAPCTLYQDFLDSDSWLLDLKSAFRNPKLPPYALCPMLYASCRLLLSQQKDFQHPAEGKDIFRVPLAEQYLPGHPSYGRVASGLCNEKVGE